MHILVVDDDQAVRDSLARSLQYGSGYEVTTAEDGLDELSARLRALTRRSRPDQETGAETLTFADLVMDLSTREVSRGGRRISLTRTEFALLQTFMEHPRHVLERGWLLNEVWGFDFPTTANSLDVYIGYLRRKTEQEGEPRLIHTIRTVGYVLRETPP